MENNVENAAFQSDLLEATKSPMHSIIELTSLHNIGCDGDKMMLSDSLYSIDCEPESFRASEDSLSHAVQTVPDMWSKDYIGLYSQYAVVGLLDGSSGTLIPFCVYAFDGASNVCSNAANITFFAWNMKIFFAILTDTYHPFGLRRKPWMLMGMSMVLLLLLILACSVHTMTVSEWMITLLFLQEFLMFSDVPADGYCVELGHLESVERRGQILATGQCIRFTFCIVAGLIQTFLLNGPSTNMTGCQIAFSECWSWGLNINQYYGFLFVLIFFLSVPIVFLKELDATHIPRHTVTQYFHEIWLTMQNLTTFYLLIFVIGVYTLTNFTNNANIYLQYYVIKLTSFETGIDTVTTNAALVLAIWIFQRYLINRNWRVSQYVSTMLVSLMGLVWILAYYDVGGTMNPWFTIFIDLDFTFASGISQVLMSMAVIELAKPGLEATTYELIMTVSNSVETLNGILSTQLLTPMKAVGCDDDLGDCSSNTVTITSKKSFIASDGPERFTNYTLLLTCIAITGCVLFTRFLPASKEECAEWKKEGEKLGTSELRGYLSLVIVVLIVTYGVIASILLLDMNTACLSAVGGEGC